MCVKRKIKAQHLYCYLYAVVKDTASKLLFCGKNRQHRTLAVESLISRTHFPVADSHNLQVPSDEAETMKSLAIDQSKSLMEEVCPRNVCSSDGGS